MDINVRDLVSVIRKRNQELDEKLKNNKINIPSKLLDEDLENKIKQLEDPGSKKSNEENNG